MLRLFAAIAIAIYLSGCVTAPLVDFGDRDTPFVNVQIDSEEKEPHKEEGKQTERKDK